MKSKCRERNANELAGMLSTGQIGRLFSKCVTIGDWGVASGITKRLASHAGTSCRSLKGLPSLGSGHVVQESAMWLPSGWQGGPNLPP